MLLTRLLLLQFSALQIFLWFPVINSSDLVVICSFRLARPNIFEQGMCGFLWILKSHLERVKTLSPDLLTQCKHTHMQTLSKPSLNCYSVPTYCRGYRLEHKFGRLQVYQKLFPTDLLKLFWTVKDLCPTLLSLTDLPWGPSSFCHITGMLLISTITARTPVVCLSNFLLHLYNEVILRSGWLKYYGFSWSENQG